MKGGCFMDIFLMQLFSGLSVSSIYLLAALGLAITFGLMGVINMAHGEFIMIGAYTTYVVERIWTAVMPNLSDGFFIAAIFVSFIVSAVIGIVLERLVIRHLYGRPLDSLLVTWGISLILQQAARSIFGAANVSVSCPSFLNKNIQVVGAFSMSYKRLFILALSIVCVSVLASHDLGYMDYAKIFCI